MDEMPAQLQEFKKLYELIAEYLVTYSFQILGAVIILIIGWWLASKVSKLVCKVCEKRNLDATLSGFFSSLAKTTVILLFVVVAVSQLGFTIAPLIAAIGALTFGISLAIQGPISNYGAGLAIILTRPYKLGDTIILKERCGIVDDIKLAMTVLRNEDGERIFIPNKEVVGEIFHNSQENKLMEAEIAIGYDADPEVAIGLIQDMLASKLSDAAKIQVGIDRFSPLGFHLVYRCWVPTAEYFAQRFQLNLSVYQALKQAGFSMPTPTQNVQVVGSDPLAGQ
ncbi:mechanosensitive ion channel family protein [Thalassotalea euphylliae]|uniref:Small-conductance mechanosensitive channel n=1 Tax=Thalassotalea euphylliae TaxID=1655234 RepID=A0A3E0U9I9_9GAMM|nr:mechanosensitive ion channel family protein [Thalassotalea euphylliae]REL32512.1 mechanosensitive ion channel family protein [Thalassotalea euphylliae]